MRNWWILTIALMIIIGAIASFFTNAFGVVMTSFVVGLIMNGIMIAVTFTNAIAEIFFGYQGAWRKNKIRAWLPWSTPFSVKPFWYREKKEYLFEKEFKFTKNSIYQNPSGIHKLFGVSFIHPHKESYRIGFECVNNTFYLYRYNYINGVRMYKQIGETAIDKEFTIIARIKNGLLNLSIHSKGLIVYERDYEIFKKNCIAWVNNIYAELNNESITINSRG